MHVILLAPHFPANQRRFLRGLKEVGATVTGICDAPLDRIDGEVRGMLDAFEYVGNLGDERALLAAVRRVQKRGPWVHRFESTVEAHMLVTARVREAAGIPGLSYETVNLCRDKVVMKQYLRSRGVPCAMNAAISNAEEAVAFAKEVGYPLILKPRDGAGAHGTYRIDSDSELAQLIKTTGLDRGGRDLTMEEFISGHEGFYDTLTVNGHVVFDAISHYYPGVLEAMRTRWINPYILVTNRMSAPGYQELRHFGHKVVAEMGIGTAATHMEWFAGPKGLSFSEIGARPPGCNLWDIYQEANDFDLYTEWARAVCYGDVHAGPSRQKAGGLIAIRPNQDGRVVGYSGVEAMQAKYGQYVFRSHLPPVGSQTQPVDAGFLANAYFYVTHPNYDDCRSMLEEIGQTVKMWAE